MSMSLMSDISLENFQLLPQIFAAKEKNKKIMKL
jgi:hypothetical protein